MLYDVLAKVPTRPARLMSVRILWRRSVTAELAFWQRWLETGGLEWPEDFQRRFNPDTPLDESIVCSAIERLARPDIRILDVGAGPVTSLGKVYPGRAIEIVPVDALAAAFNRLLGASGFRPPVRTLTGHAERLPSDVKDRSFDIAFARNSLDHTWNPMRAIRNMIEATSDDGFVLLKHRRNEAQAQSYQDLHQWNFDLRSGDLVIWNRLVSWNVDRELGRGMTVSTHETAGFLESIITRR